MDLSFEAFEKLAHPMYGVMMIERRRVDCDSGKPIDYRTGVRYGKLLCVRQGADGFMNDSMACALLSLCTLRCCHAASGNTHATPTLTTLCIRVQYYYKASRFKLRACAAAGPQQHYLRGRYQGWLGVAPDRIQLRQAAGHW